VDHDLTRLGSHEFEHLTQAPCMAALGARLSTFGDGPDGGREATVEGRLTWDAEGGAAAVWDGYTVIQAKFRVRPEGVQSNLKWLRTELRKELSRWTDSRYKRSKTRKPDNLLIVTNVALSAAAAGGVDTANEEIAALIDKHSLNVKAWRLWHYDDLCALLDVHRAVRITYGGFLTTGDVLAHIDELLGGQHHDVQAALTAHAVKEMIAQQYVRLGQAGDPNDEKLSLGRVAIDVAATTSPRFEILTEGLEYRRGSVLGAPNRRAHELLKGSPVLVIKTAPGAGKSQAFGELLSTLDNRSPVLAAAYILNRGERVHDHGLAKGQPRHLLLVGGPGQGKSTLAQMVCQAYRVSLLRDAESLSAEAGGLRKRLEDDFARIGLELPSHLRWPVRVNLSDYGNFLTGDPDLSLLRYLAQRVSAASPHDITASDLALWLGRWPWLLVLDGLDEVASPYLRERVTAGVSNFLVDAAAVKADVLVVATTRPQGYAGEFGAEEYERLDLMPLDANAAMTYAHRLTAARFHDNDELRQQVQTRLQEATVNPDSSRLMTTPLQVTIMALLLERRQRAPHDRYQLFDAYFDTIYARETNKPTALGRLLEDHRSDIEAIHEMVALALQQEAETQTERDASMPASRLRAHALHRLQGEGHDEEQAARLADQLVDAATRRLVLLVPHKVDEVTFEVRSLQEYMAARALTNDDGPAILDRLRPLVASAHWRNTWLFAAGRIFREREKLRESLISLLAKVDNEGLLPWLARTGAELATDLLADDLAFRSPQYRRLLADQAITRLDGPPDSTWRSLATLLTRIATEDPLIRQKLDQQVNMSLAAGGSTRAHVVLMLDVWQRFTGGLATRARQLQHQYDDPNSPENIGTLLLRELITVRDPKLPRRKRALRLAEYLASHVPQLGGDDEKAMKRLIGSLHDSRVSELRYEGDLPKNHVTIVTQSQMPEITVLEDALGRPAVADAFSVPVDQIPPWDWHVASMLREIVRYWYSRRTTVISDLGKSSQPLAPCG
jgi:hypothetical protein